MTVQDLAFDENSSLHPPSVPAQVLSTAENSPVLVKYAALLLGIIAVLAFGVRPALRRAGSLAQSEKEKTKARELHPGPAQTASNALPAPQNPEMDPERIRTQEIFDQVSSHLKREPTQSSRLLQSWIHSD